MPAGPPTGPPAGPPAGPPSGPPAGPPADQPGGGWAVPGGAPPPPPPPPSGADEPLGGRRRWLAAFAVIGVLILVAASVVFVDRGDDDGGDGAAPTTSEPGLDAGPDDAPTGSVPEESTTTAPTTTVAPIPEDEFLALVARLQDDVAALRGLEFLQDVVVELAPDDEFEARLLADFEEDVEELEDAEVFYRALGLLDAETDLATELRALLSVGVVGFYDPETNELVVRGASPTPYVQQTIVHELVHALDDQHFELDRDQYQDDPGEISTGFTSLVEGNARRIEDRWIGDQPEEFRDRAETEEQAYGAGIDVSRFPEMLIFEIVAPYEFGPIFVRQLLQQGGERAVDAAFADPPTTSEQVLDPTRYLDREPAVAVPVPPADGEIVDEGAVGALFLVGLLTTGDTTVNPTDAFRAVDGWGGDQAVTWEDGDLDCVRWDVVGDTDQDTDEIEQALTEWATGSDTVTVSVVDGRVRVDSCLAGAGAVPPQV